LIFQFLPIFPHFPLFFVTWSLKYQYVYMPKQKFKGYKLNHKITIANKTNVTNRKMLHHWKNLVFTIKYRYYRLNYTKQNIGTLIWNYAIYIKVGMRATDLALNFKGKFH
jgi:hypothetical protein